MSTQCTSVIEMNRVSVAYHAFYDGVSYKQAHCSLQDRHTIGVHGHHAVWHVEPGSTDVFACHVMYVWKEAARMIIQLQSTSSAIRQNVEVRMNWSSLTLTLLHKCFIKTNIRHITLELLLCLLLLCISGLHCHAANKRRLIDWLIDLLPFDLRLKLPYILHMSSCSWDIHDRRAHCLIWYPNSLTKYAIDLYRGDSD